MKISMIISAVMVSAVVGASATAMADYNLTTAVGGTVKYEVKQTATNVTTSTSIIRSLGTTTDANLGIFRDGTLSPSVSNPAGTTQNSGDGFISATAQGGSDNEPNGTLDYLTQGSSVNKSTLDLTFNAPAGQDFASGDFRVNTTVLPNGASLWDPGVDYLAWQVSTDGGTSFTDIYRRTYDGVSTSRMDSGVLTIPGISGFSSIIIRGTIDSSGGAQTVSTNSHWQLLDTPPFTTGSFNGGLELNLTTEAVVPEPATLGVLALGGVGLLARKRR